MESWSLLELNRYIKQKLKSSVAELYWVTAEINEITINSSGHCFMELIEKAPQSGQITAKIRANIWAYHFRMLNPYFETVTGQNLAAGLKVMLQASVEYHELYGISLQVTDINPAFTVGDLALQKQAIINQLTEEGVIDMNRELELPLLLQRIAVISSGTAAGYGDFIDQLHSNPHDYAFSHTLFQATMQGNEAETSIINALERIFDRENDFDAVVLIRGGGSQSDLNCFNSYQLACCLAQFPLPVITGIGHDRDETVADRVACVSLKTPTAVAEYLINKTMTLDRTLQGFSRRLTATATYSIRSSKGELQQLSQQLRHIIQTRVHEQDKKLQSFRLRLSHAVSTLLSREIFVLDRLKLSLQTIPRKKIQSQNETMPVLLNRLNKLTGALISEKKKQLSWLNKRTELLHPDKLLKRGYSITLAGGKTVRSIKNLDEGQRIKTLFYDGAVESVVEKISENHHHSL